VPKWSQSYTPPPCRWAFIDGNHSAEGVQIDITKALEAGCRGMLFHDAGEGQPAYSPDGHGTDARRVAIYELRDWELFDITTPCGLIWAEK